MKSYNNILSLYGDLRKDIKSINSDLEIKMIASDLLRVYYLEKSILDIKYINKSSDFVLEDYLNNTQVCKPDEVYKEIESILLDLNYIHEGYITEGRITDMRRPLNEELMDINFDEFDEIIAKEIIAKKDDDEVEIAVPEVDADDIADDFADDDFEDLSDDDIDDILLDFDDDGYLDVDEIEDDIEDEEDEEDAEEEEELIDDCTHTASRKAATVTEDVKRSEVQVDEELVESKSDAKPSKSLMQIYESKRSRKPNKIVEALLVDNTVEDIERVLKDTLDSHGISAAERVSVLGLILDRMLHASDEEIEAPDYLNDMIGDVVGDKEIADMITNTVEKVLNGDTEPLPSGEAILPDDVEVDLITSDGIETITAEEDKE